MGHIIKHEVTCDFAGCDSVKRTEHPAKFQCIVCGKPGGWVFISGSEWTGREEIFCHLHNIGVISREDGVITISEEPEDK